MRPFLKKVVVGAVTLALALSFVDVTQASSQSNDTAGKSGHNSIVAKGKGGSKGKGSGKGSKGKGSGKGSKGKGNGKGMAKGKGKYKGKWKNKNYKWKHQRFSDGYGTTLYSDDGDDTPYYWCQPDDCYYPLSYCPYGKYSWPQ